MTSHPAVSLSQLRFAWPGQPTLLSVDRLEITQGEMVLLHGPSGCGKTTLLGLITGVLTASAGDIRVLGADFAAMSARSRDALRGEQMGVIFQQFNLLPFLSVAQNVLLPLQLFDRRLSAATASLPDGRLQSPEQEAERLLSALGLGADLLHRPAYQLSVGQQQRVAAARALIGHPSLIIADEPTSALDEANQLEFLTLLMTQARQTGATLLMVSHQMRIAPLFDRTIEFTQVNQPC
jgi:putative ABC transport system ATP-binding protein